MWDQIEQSLHQSMQRVFTKIAILLPGVLAFVVVLITFAVLAALATYIVKRILVATRFDQRLNERTSSIAEWSPSQSPTMLIGRVVFWAFLLAGVLVGLSAYDAATDSLLTGYISAYLPHVIGAVILLFLGNLVARFLSRTVLIGAVNMNLHYARLLASGVKWLVLVLTVAMVLDHLSIAGVIVDMAFGILFGGIVLALALAVGLGSRDLVSRSIEREVSRPQEPANEEKLHHF
jgi:Conserved TM helix